MSALGATGNDDGPTVGAADPSELRVSEETMKTITQGVRVERARWSAGQLAATIVVSSADQTQVVPVTIAGVTEGRALSLVNAMGKLLLGAVVMDAPDVHAIRDSLDNARGLAGALAPEHTDATLAIEAIQIAQGRVRLAKGVVS